MNRNVFKYVLLLIGAMFVTSCSKSSDSSNVENGTLSLSFVEDARVNVKSAPANLVYGITVYNKAGDVVASYPDHTALQSITLAAGTYRVVAQSAQDTSNPLGSPLYRGENSNVKIAAGTSNNIAIECALANIKVSANFSQKISDNFKNYKAIFTSGDVSITFYPGDNDKEGYIPASADGTFKLTLELINKQSGTENVDQTQYFYQIIKDVKARDYFKFNFDIDENGSATDGGGAFKLIVKSETEVIDNTFIIETTTLPAPTIAAESGHDLSTPIMVNADKRGAAIKINLAAQANMQEVMMMHNNVELVNRGIPTQIDLCRIDPAVGIILNNNGIKFSPIQSNDTQAWIDFSELFNVLGLGQYAIQISVLDAQRQLAKVTVSVDVMPDMNYQLTNVTPWAKFATVKGVWHTLEKPQNLTFEYARFDSETWTQIAQSDITSDDANKSVSARVKGLSPDTQYRFRLVGQDPSGTPYDPSNIVNASTEIAPEIPNLNFDTWVKSGKNWYPNADGSNSFWATGNEGVTMALVNKAANTIETTDAVQGKAARMETIKVPIVNVAAGNLFTGSYSTNISNPASSAKMGREYKGRPIGLRGWYKYTKVNGDKGNVYLLLRNGGTRIAFGELVIDKTVGEYTYFEFMLDYKDLVTKPTHVELVATSSIGGANFVGEYGSTLYVDEFELIWE